MLEKEHEHLYKQINESNYQQHKNDEQRNHQRKKEECKKMGNVLLNQMIDKSEKKQEEKRYMNEPVDLQIGGVGEKLFQEMSKRQRQLNSELIGQIRKKELDREYEKLYDEGEQGLRFGEGVRPRTAYDNMYHVEQLKKQMQERKMKEEDDKYVCD